MNNLQNTFNSPLIDYGYPLIVIIVGAFLLWLTFTKAGRSSLSGFGDVAYLGTILIVIWIAFLLVMAWFFGLLKFLVN